MLNCACMGQTEISTAKALRTELRLKLLPTEDEAELASLTLTRLIVCYNEKKNQHS